MRCGDRKEGNRDFSASRDERFEGRNRLGIERIEEVFDAV